MVHDLASSPLHHLTFPSSSSSSSSPHFSFLSLFLFLALALSSSSPHFSFPLPLPLPLFLFITSLFLPLLFTLPLPLAFNTSFPSSPFPSPLQYLSFPPFPSPSIFSLEISLFIPPSSPSIPFKICLFLCFSSSTFLLPLFFSPQIYYSLFFFFSSSFLLSFSLPLKYFPHSSFPLFLSPSSLFLQSSFFLFFTYLYPLQNLSLPSPLPLQNLFPSPSSS